MQFKLKMYLGKSLVSVADIEAETFAEGKQIAASGQYKWRKPTAEEMVEETAPHPRLKVEYEEDEDE